jgi:hypothetical protein
MSSNSDALRKAGEEFKKQLQTGKGIRGPTTISDLKKPSITTRGGDKRKLFQVRISKRIAPHFKTLKEGDVVMSNYGFIDKVTPMKKYIFGSNLPGITDILRGFFTSQHTKVTEANAKSAFIQKRARILTIAELSGIKVPRRIAAAGGGGIGGKITFPTSPPSIIEGLEIPTIVPIGLDVSLPENIQGWSREEIWSYIASGKYVAHLQGGGPDNDTLNDYQDIYFTRELIKEGEELLGDEEEKHKDDESKRESKDESKRESKDDESKFDKVFLTEGQRSRITVLNHFIKKYGTLQSRFAGLGIGPSNIINELWSSKGQKFTLEDAKRLKKDPTNQELLAKKLKSDNIRAFQQKVLDLLTENGVSVPIGGNQTEKPKGEALAKLISENGTLNNIIATGLREIFIEEATRRGWTPEKINKAFPPLDISRPVTPPTRHKTVREGISDEMINKVKRRLIEEFGGSEKDAERFINRLFDEANIYINEEYKSGEVGYDSIVGAVRIGIIESLNEILERKIWHSIDKTGKRPGNQEIRNQIRETISNNRPALVPRFIWERIIGWIGGRITDRISGAASSIADAVQPLAGVAGDIVRDPLSVAPIPFPDRIEFPGIPFTIRNPPVNAEGKLPNPQPIIDRLPAPVRNIIDQIRRSGSFNVEPDPFDPGSYVVTVGGREFRIKRNDLILLLLLIGWSISEILKRINQADDDAPKTPKTPKGPTPNPDSPTDDEFSTIKMHADNYIGGEAKIVGETDKEHIADLKAWKEYTRRVLYNKNNPVDVYKINQFII